MSLTRVCSVGLYLVALVLLASACTSSSGNFSQYPGFDEWYAANPPVTHGPTEAEQTLLARFQPRLFIAKDSGRPISFYEDYIAHGRLFGSNGQIISDAVDQSTLNTVADDPGAVFVHHPSESTTNKPSAVARIDRESLPAIEAFAERPLIFLTYHYVFATSGVAAGIRSWQRFFINLFADTSDWHQLDHYTAVSVILDETSQQPIALMLQQHNYLRTWILTAETGPGRTQLPPDGRVSVVAARDSNELFLRRDDQPFRRAVPMMTSENVRWLVMGQGRPIVTADDLTSADTEVAASLRFLPPSDAFFTFKGWLGERRITPGRDGPPGADFNTWPDMMPRARQLARFWWHENDQDYVDLVESGSERGATELAPYWRRLHRALPPPVTTDQAETQDLTRRAPSS
ncbi:MAG: hypothetical protein AB8C46_12975 [Burkholderiaceae bacterium]